MLFFITASKVSYVLKYTLGLREVRDQRMKPIGFVGLGQMGKPMARNLLKNHFSTAVFSRSKGPVQELVEAGAQESSSLVEMGRTCEVIVLSLPSPEAVREVTLGANSITDSLELTVKTIIDTSTIDPSTSRELELQLLARSVNFLDAPVSGGPERAAEGTLTFMVGGNKERYEDCHGILTAMGKNIFYMGKGGSGQATKLVNQVLVSAHAVATAEAIRFSEALGLNTQEVMKVIEVSAGDSFVFRTHAPKMAVRDFTGGWQIYLMQKDLELIIKTAKELSLELFIPPVSRSIYSSAVKKGNGKKNLSSLIAEI